MAKPIRFREKWRIRWVDYTGQRRSAVLASYRDAEYILNQRQLESERIRRGLCAPPKPIRTFSELAQQWLETRSVQKRSGADDASILRRHLVPFFEKNSIVEITQRDCDVYLSSKPGLSQKTLHNHMTLLIAMLNHAVRCGWMERVPSIKKPTIHETREYSYLRTQDEIVRFLNAARAESGIAYFLYFTAIHTGLRAGELAGLRWDDVDWERRTLIVQRGYDRPTKSGRIRYVPILDALLPLLREEKSKAITPWVFPNAVGRMHQESSRVFQEIFGRVLTRAGFPRCERRGKSRGYIVFHDLRHTFASHWVMRGGDIYKLQKILGHASITQTEQYSHLSPEAFRSDFGRFEPLMNDIPVVPDQSDLNNIYRLSSR